MRLQCAIVCVALVLLATCAQADVVRVDWLGGGDYMTLEDGIAAASEGDTVLVAAGTYTGTGNKNLDFEGVNIVLLSESGPEATVINVGGYQSNRAIYFHTGEDSTSMVSGFTITNGYIYNAGGIYIGTGCSPIIEDCIFTYHQGQHGGAIYMTGSASVIRDCEFTSNSGDQHGGGISCWDSTPVVARCEFNGNGSGYGGGISCRASDVEIFDCSFELNSGSYGGAISLAEDTSGTVTRCLFKENSAGLSGGAMSFLLGADVTVTDCLMVDNVATLFGGCVYCQEAAPLVSNCTMVGGSAPSAGGIYCLTNGNATFEADVLALCRNGGAMAGSGSNPTTTHCIIYGNTGGDALVGTEIDNMVYDPLFCDADAGDFTHCADSQCLAVNNGWGVAVGSEEMGCPPCETTVQSMSWGAVKALYR